MNLAGVVEDAVHWADVELGHILMTNRILLPMHLS